jgi:ABC-type branched-subunit amino acid transport system substrate-binding protein
MTADIGKEYANFKTSRDRDSYEQSFIKSFSEGYKKAGAKASAFFGWRTFSDYKTKDPNMTVVAAYAHDQTTSLLFVISHEGRIKKIVEIVAVRRLDNAEAAKNQ